MVTGALLFSLANYIAQSGVSHTPVKLLIAPSRCLQCFRMQNPLARRFENSSEAPGSRSPPEGDSLCSYAD
ncbi:hypothetical protein CN221_37260 [Sinorhizobium meliloti]|nr:hypothetical protein SMRU11_08480 [Sinorhizobium meliloti RU11/001]RVG55061.1 hypothetical protein CN222_35515 [Sinorhizobium meliloti]RVG80661.1 hypothetical protein CN221_37260 [Sinorhizobium meliloti]RVH54680.1 hypothetical protein CN209_35115 [Sinorhizobium meliloti]RVH71498.1 hypothetical protein CN203_30005 [Sinorhizobium meliloti]